MTRCPTGPGRGPGAGWGHIYGIGDGLGCVKTTVEIPDELYQRVRVMIAEQNTTFRSLLEDALRRVLAEHDRQRRAGTVQDLRYGAGGMSAEFAHGGWERIRDAIYEGRGA